MTQFFLKAKHWQLFILSVGLPIIVQFVMMGSLFSMAANSTPPTPSSMISFSLLFGAMMILFIGIHFGWFWTIVTALHKRLEEHLQFNIRRFKILFFIPLVYILCILMLISSALTFQPSMEAGAEPEWILPLILISIPLHFFSMFCIFHTMYFCAKTLKTAELKKKVSFSDFAGEFFMVWFFPIGIWILQPKINQLIEEGQ